MVPSSAAVVIVVAVALPTRLPGKVTPVPDNADFLTTISGNIGVWLFSEISLIATCTRSYDCRPDLIRTAASFTTQEPARRAEDAAEHRANKTFRRGLGLGTETDCGTVIQLRGPMVENALQPVRLTPNGQSVV